MPVVIAYQSLNSNSSVDHSVTAANSQHFTRQTQDYYAQTTTKPTVLSYPTLSTNTPNYSPTIPVQGPPDLIDIAPKGSMKKGEHSDTEFAALIGGKMAQLHQGVYRAFGQPCDLLTIGELDSAHPQWSTLQQTVGAFLYSTDQAKACNCFSVHGQAHINDVIAESKSAGWIAVKCGSVVVVFVHVPNSIAKKVSDSQTFYAKMRDKVAKKGHSIDLIMGDTNQGSDKFTPNVVSAALGGSFRDAHAGSSISPGDFFNKTVSGTNSNATKKYDVVVYNTATIKSIEVQYISQFSPSGYNAYAITDHMGVVVKVSK
jgi:hypothetical protein